MKEILECILLKQVLVERKLKFYDRQSLKFRVAYICKHSLTRIAIIAINLLIFDENE